jgi:hypothetical protein
MTFHAALVSDYESSASTIEPRLRFDALQGEITMDEAQRISDTLPLAVSLRATAQRLRNGGEFPIDSGLVLKVLKALGIDPPPWLDKHARQAVIVAPDSSIRLAESDSGFGKDGRWIAEGQPVRS